MYFVDAAKAFPILDFVLIFCYYVEYSTICLYIEIPRMPRELSVEFDNSNASLLVTITWLPPGNSGQLDLEEYTVNVTTTSGINNSTQVPAGTTELQLTTDRTQRATFNVTITATNMCGQTGNATSEVQEYDPCKTCSSMSYYMLQLLSNCMLSEFRVPVLLKIMYMAMQELLPLFCCFLDVLFTTLLGNIYSFHSEIYTIAILGLAQDLLIGKQ